MQFVLDRFILQDKEKTTINNLECDIEFSTSRDIQFSLVRHNLNRNCSLPFLFKSGTVAAAGLLDENDEGVRIRKYSKLLMPLLFETWMEVRPAALNDLLKFNMAEDDVHISNEAAFTLKTILEIIEKLHELMTYWDEEVNNHDLTEWFRTTHNKEFCAQFLLGFPYLQGDGFQGMIPYLCIDN